MSLPIRSIRFALLLILLVSKPAMAKNELPAAPPVYIESTLVTVQPLAHKIDAQGELKAFKSVVLQSDIAGKVVKLNLSEGKAVQADEPVIWLENSIYAAQLKQAQAKYNLSKVTYHRLKTLLEKGTGSASEVEQALASLEFDEASVELAAAQLNKTEIKAPFSGVLGLKDIDVGDYINPGQKLVELVDIAHLLVDFYLPEKYLSQLKEGLAVQIRVDSVPDQIFTGKVFAISPTLDPVLRALHVRALVENIDFRLKPGLFSRLSLILATFPEALTIPEQAVVYQENKVYVFKIVDGAAKLTEITLGIREMDFVQVVEGLASQDRIVLAGQVNLYDGARVVDKSVTDKPVKEER